MSGYPLQILQKFAAPLLRFGQKTVILTGERTGPEFPAFPAGGAGNLRIQEVTT